MKTQSVDYNSASNEMRGEIENKEINPKRKRSTGLLAVLLWLFLLLFCFWFSVTSFSFFLYISCVLCGVKQVLTFFFLCFYYFFHLSTFAGCFGLSLSFLSLLSWLLGLYMSI